MKWIELREQWVKEFQTKLCSRVHIYKWTCVCELCTRLYIYKYCIYVYLYTLVYAKGSYTSWENAQTKKNQITDCRDTQVCTCDNNIKLAVFHLLHEQLTNESNLNFVNTIYCISTRSNRLYTLQNLLVPTPALTSIYNISYKYKVAKIENSLIAICSYKVQYIHML